MWDFVGEFPADKSHPRVRCVILFYSILVTVRNNTQSIDSNRKQIEHRFKHIDISSVNGFELQNEQSIDSNSKDTWGSPGTMEMQSVHPSISSDVIRGQTLTATQTHCVKLEFSISNQSESASRLETLKSNQNTEIKSNDVI